LNLIPEDAFILATSKSVEEILKARFARAKKIQKFARNNESGNEDVWTADIKSKVFYRWEEATKVKPSEDSLDIDGAVAMFVPSLNFYNLTKLIFDS